MPNASVINYATQNSRAEDPLAAASPARGFMWQANATKRLYGRLQTVKSPEKGWVSCWGHGPTSPPQDVPNLVCLQLALSWPSVGPTVDPQLALGFLHNIVNLVGSHSLLIIRVI